MCIRDRVKEPVAKESNESDFSNLGIEVEENYNIEEVVADVTAYVQIVEMCIRDRLRLVMVKDNP